MYNKSYRGYKSNRYKFPNRYGRRNFRDVIFSDPQIIRLIIVVFVVLIVSGAVIAGFIIKRNSKPETVETPVTNISISDDAQLLNVVNRNNPLESTFVPPLKNYGDFKVNQLAIGPLKEMINAARKDNVDLKITTAYISCEQQDELFNEKYEEFFNSGNYTMVTAEAKAQSLVPKGGNSEYQTGLLFEFATSEGDKLFEDTAAYRWLDKHCTEYGFILRYSAEKKAMTLMEGNSSVFRFVGKENAKMMRTLNMCLDEYADYISSRE